MKSEDGNENEKLAKITTEVCKIFAKNLQIKIYK
jgi:hypothetical protein